MGMRQYFENEFPGCTSISRIEIERQLKQQIDGEIHNLTRACSALNNKAIYIKAGDEYERCPVSPVAEDTVNVSVPSKKRHIQIDLHKLRNNGFIWLYDLGDRLWLGREIRKRFRNKIADRREQRKRLQRGISQMKFNWSSFRLALTDSEVMHAEYIGLRLTEALLDLEPVFPSKQGWEEVGFYEFSDKKTGGNTR